MKKKYTDETNALVLISLLKDYGIRKVIASPGTTNMALVASMQHDPHFEMYSSVDERSAAYMACGMAAESGEPVVISCTGATASRNYLPGMTEAYYRKLPVIAITSTQEVSKVGHNIAQIIDRSQIPNDAAKLSLTLPIVKDPNDQWDCETKVNQALLEISHDGGGPVHINLQTTYSNNYRTERLPQFRRINRVSSLKDAPSLPQGNIGVLIGSHKNWSQKEENALSNFCEKTGAAVFCDHTSGYTGKNRIQSALLTGQTNISEKSYAPDILIHIGEVTGDYYGIKVAKNRVWRVNPDGVIRDTFRKLEIVFEMPEIDFFEHYTDSTPKSDSNYYNTCLDQLNEVRQKIPELPFSNIWIASQTASRIPKNSVIHFGILNSLRSWNFFELPPTVSATSNVGGFGIDGGLSSFIGASLCYPNKLYFCVIGDLAFFYDMNSLGNRHLSKNLRILMINNGKGTEFKQYGHLAIEFGDEADQYISAAGHFGKQSPSLVKNYSKDLGFEYINASNKEEFLAKYEQFTSSETYNKPILFEVFTQSPDESKALEIVLNLKKEQYIAAKASVESMARKALGKSGISVAKKLLGR